VDNYLARLLEEIDAVGDGPFTDPGDPLAPGDEVVGLMTRFQRQVYTLGVPFTARLSELTQMAQKQQAEGGQEEESAHLERHIISEKAAILWGVLWADICNTFNLRCVAIALRVGFQVVLKVPEEEDLTAPDVTVIHVYVTPGPDPGF